MTQEEQRGQQQETYKKTLEIMEELSKKVEDPKYKDQGYANGEFISMPAELFTQLTNLLSQYSVSNRSAMQVSEAMEMALAPINAKMMELHLDNVDQGKTVSFAELDREDAKAKIKEVKK